MLTLLSDIIIHVCVEDSKVDSLIGLTHMILYGKLENVVSQLNFTRLNKLCVHHL